MRRVTTTAAAAVAALLVAFTIDARAQITNPSRTTFITISGAVELPGLRLEPGTYVMRLLNEGERGIVQVLTRDERRVLGHWLSVPRHRLDPAEETLIMFRETAEGTTPAVQFWWAPGDSVGREFIYPKDQAARIAARTGAAVLTAEGRVTAEPPAARVEEQPRIAEVPETTTVPEEVTAGVLEQPGIEQERPVGTTGVEEAPAEEPEATTAAAPAELPSTASPLAAAGLLGLLSLAVAAGLRRYRR